MSDDSMLCMPPHEPDDGYPCSTDRVRGYVTVLDNGHLHCNRCGWTTPEEVVLTYSGETNRRYLTFEDLVRVEANGWVVVGVISTPKQSWPWIVGPYADKAEATRAKVRAKRRFSTETSNLLGTRTAKWFVRPAWKDEKV